MGESVTLQRKTPLARGTSQLKRTPLKQGTSQLKRTRLAPVSAQRKAENADEWPALKALVDARDGDRCRIAAIIPEIRCGGPMTHHHVEPTGQGYPRICDPELLLKTCEAHHTGPGGIHDNTDRARKRGVLR